MREPVRVAFLYPIYFEEAGQLGGGERYALELARAVAEVTEARLISFAEVRRSFREGPLQVELFPWITLLKGRRNNPLAFSFLGKLLWADVIHCIGWRILATDVAILLAKGTGKRVFVTDVGGGADISISYRLPIYRLVDRFLFCSRFGAALYPEAASRAAVIYGGIDPERFLPLEGRRDGKVLYVGRLIPAKGINYLLEALDAETPLTVFGRPYHPEYYQLLQRLAVGKRVRFVTEGSDADLVREYQTSAVTVLPSVFTDVYGSYYPAPNVLGLTLLESMACETPVVCTDGGPERELVEDGVTGYVVPPNDPKALGERIACLLDDAARAAAMGRLGRERVLERFTWQAVAERCLDIYQGAAGHDGAAPGRSSGRSRGRHG